MRASQTQKLPWSRQQTTHQKQRRHLTTLQEEPRQERPSIMESMRERCATAEHRLTVQDLERMMYEEIIAEERRTNQASRHAAKVTLQQRARSSSNKDTRFQSVLCNNFSDEHKLSKCPSEQKRCRPLWSPKLPRFLQMSTWGRATKVRPSGMS